MKGEKHNGDYVIVGDTQQYKGCLVCVAGTFERANEILIRMISNPTDNDRRLMDRHTNFRIEFVEDKDCWWNGNCD